MSTLEAGMEAAARPPAASPGPGASLKSARERAGLSLDEAAQQLKLAPRQVRALEEEAFEQLPGRTFVRGFVRNYARLLHLDGDALIAELPDAAHAPGLAAPPLHATGAAIGEVPGPHAPRAAFGRWFIPLLLIGCIVGAGAYEWYRSAATTPAQPAGVEPVAAAPTLPGTTRSELPNPLAPAPVAESVPSETRDAALPPATANAPIESSLAAAATSEPGPQRDAPPPSATPQPSAPAETPLVLNYRGPSWTEIRDRSGQVALARLVPAGSEQTIGGSAPFDLVIGNARAVTLTYRGKTVDLARYTRQNVARLRLQ